MGLPAQQSQFKMSPPFRRELLEKYKLKVKGAKKAGVMALFYPGDDALTYFALILRNAYPGVHSRQIGFPGGKLESTDTSLMAAALREMEEEIGVSQGDVEVIKAMTDLYIPPSNFHVFPFIGMVNDRPRFTIDTGEVQRLIEIPLRDLLDEGSVTTEQVKTSYSRAAEVPAFRFDEHIVWGATAMILSEIKDVITKSITAH